MVHRPSLLYNTIMIEFDIPGRRPIRLEHLVCDLNGTLVVDGELVPGVKERLKALQDRLLIHILSADTHGRAAETARSLDLPVALLMPGREGEQKEAFIRKRGALRTAAIGQGANDARMLKAARVGICVASPEGTAMTCLAAADILVPDILSAFDLLDKPKRLIATLRR